MNEETQKDETTKKEIVVYSTPTCHFCHAAKDYFNEKGIEFTEKDVSTDLQARQEMIEKSGQMGVPQILIGSELIVGFDKEKIESLLEQK
jgi:glutaredoxin-like YruB-family protein